MTSIEQRVAIVLERHGTTYATQAGIRLRDTPAPLYQLLVLTTLLAARISSEIAVSAAAELFGAGLRTPRAMLDASRQQRVDALGRGGYRRFDERTATMLDDGARLLQERHRGDLRRLRQEAEGDGGAVAGLLQEFPGVGPAGADIFGREVQGVWPQLAPWLDERTLRGARLLELPADRLAALVAPGDLPRLAAACVRASLDDGVAQDVADALAGKG